MSTRTILERATQAGIQLYLSNGQLRYRGDHQMAEVLLPEIRAHKAEIIAELSSQADAPAAVNFVHWSKLTPEQRQAIIPTIKAGRPVRIFSGVLGEMVWWTRDEQTAEVLKQDPRYQGEVIYALAELVQIQGKSLEFLRDIHRFKKEFGARLAKAEPKPASFFISPM